MFKQIFLLLLLGFVGASESQSQQNELADAKLESFSVEGRIMFRTGLTPPNWQSKTRIMLNYGKHIGFVREDGSFIVDGVPSGSYILDVSNTEYIFEPVRVDITSKGKIRARRLNLIQPNTVVSLQYPLQLQPRQPAKYFRAREEWRVTDVLMNPMVIMLLVAFFLMIVTPKLASQDPQMQKEMQNMQMPKMEMPDISDMMANLFGGGSGGKKGAKKITAGPTGQKRTPR